MYKHGDASNLGSLKVLPLSEKVKAVDIIRKKYYILRLLRSILRMNLVSMKL